MTVVAAVQSNTVMSKVLGISFPSNYPSTVVRYMVMDKSNPTVELCRKYFELRDFCLFVVFVSLLSKMTAPDIYSFLFCFAFCLFFFFFFSCFFLLFY